MGEGETDKKEITKVLISLDDVLKDIKLYYAFTGSKSTDDLYMNVIRETLVAFAEEAAEEELTTMIFCSRISDALVDRYLEVYTDWNLGFDPGKPLARLAATGLTLGRGIERIIQTLFPTGHRSLRIVSAKWITEEQLLLEVRL
jgi:hypothetical protein